MIKKKNYLILLIYLLPIFYLGSCASTAPGKTPTTIAATEKMRAREKKKKMKKAKKAQKRAKKEFWKHQTKAVRKKVKASNRGLGK